MNVLLKKFAAVVACASVVISAGAQTADKENPAKIHDESLVLLRGPAGEITLREVKAAVNVIVPAAQRDDFFAYPASIEQMARTLHVYKSLNAQAKKSGFDKESEIALALAIAQERALADLWLNQMTKEKEPKPEQLEAYARSVYMSQRAPGAAEDKNEFAERKPILIEEARVKLNNQKRLELWNAAQAETVPDEAAILSQVKPLEGEAKKN